MADCLTGAAQEPAQERHAHEEARHQCTRMARVRMLGEKRGLDHGRVPGQDARVIGDQQGPPARRHVLHAGRLDAPVVAIQRLEQRQERLRPLGVEPEVVDDVVGSALRELLLLIRELHQLHHAAHVDDLAPGQVAQTRGQLAQSLDRVHRRVALQPAHGARHPHARRGCHDFRVPAVAPALARRGGVDGGCVAAHRPAVRAACPAPLWRSRLRRCR